MFVDLYGNSVTEACHALTGVRQWGTARCVSAPQVTCPKKHRLHRVPPLATSTLKPDDTNVLLL